MKDETKQQNDETETKNETKSSRKKRKILLMIAKFERYIYDSIEQRDAFKNRDKRAGAGERESDYKGSCGDIQQ